MIQRVSLQIPRRRLDPFVRKHPPVDRTDLLVLNSAYAFAQPRESMIAGIDPYHFLDLGYRNWPLLREFILHEPEVLMQTRRRNLTRRASTHKLRHNISI